MPLSPILPLSTSSADPPALEWDLHSFRVQGLQPFVPWAEGLQVQSAQGPDHTGPVAHTWQTSPMIPATLQTPVGDTDRSPLASLASDSLSLSSFLSRLQPS